MARRRMTALQRRYFGPRSAPRATIVRVSSPRAAPRRRFHRTRSAVGSLVSGGAIGYGIGGLLYGFAVKQGLVQKLPAIPLIGRTGTAALVLDFWARRGGGDMVRKAATAAAVLAGYQLGSTGAITGDDHFATAGDEDVDGYDWAEAD